MSCCSLSLGAYGLHQPSVTRSNSAEILSLFEEGISRQLSSALVVYVYSVSYVAWLNLDVAITKRLGPNPESCTMLEFILMVEDYASITFGCKAPIRQEVENPIFQLWMDVVGDRHHSQLFRNAIWNQTP